MATQTLAHPYVVITMPRSDLSVGGRIVLVQRFLVYKIVVG
jgi:hypothetical protein